MAVGALGMGEDLENMLRFRLYVAEVVILQRIHEAFILHKTWPPKGEDVNCNNLIGCLYSLDHFVFYIYACKASSSA